MSLVAALILVLGGGFLLATLTIQQPQHRLLQRSHEHDDITGEDNFRLSLHGGDDGDAIAKDHKRRLNPIKDLKKKIEEWKKKAKNLENEVNGLKSKVSSLEGEVNNLKRDVNTQKGIVQAKVKEISGLKEDLEDQVTASLEVVNEIYKFTNDTIISFASSIEGAVDKAVEESAAALVGIFQ